MRLIFLFLFLSFNVYAGETSTLYIVGRWFIRFFQIVISPQDGPNCRFKPTCSQFGMIALKKHGFLKGTIMTSERLLRCNPLGRSGKDPVPNFFIPR